MKIKREFILKKLNENTEDELSVVIAVGKYAKNVNGYIKLNETACFLWDILSKGATIEELVDGLLKEYDVSSDIAERDVDNFIKVLKSIGALDE